MHPVTNFKLVNKQFLKLISLNRISHNTENFMVGPFFHAQKRHLDRGKISGLKALDSVFLSVKPSVHRCFGSGAEIRTLYVFATLSNGGGDQPTPRL
jgi:hypothetical protein